MKTKRPFSRMSKLAQRKAIARDVLKRLSTNQLRPEFGVWARFNSPACDDVQTLLRMKKPCACCALGGAICALAAKEDKIKIAEGSNSAPFNTMYDNRQSQRLRTIFGEDQLAMIESSFEDGGGAFAVQDCGNFFGDKYTTARARMKAIFTQIAKTGLFEPAKA